MQIIWEGCYDFDRGLGPSRSEYGLIADAISWFLRSDHWINRAWRTRVKEVFYPHQIGVNRFGHLDRTMRSAERMKISRGRPRVNMLIKWFFRFGARLYIWNYGKESLDAWENTCKDDHSIIVRILYRISEKVTEIDGDHSQIDSCFPVSFYYAKPMGHYSYLADHGNWRQKATYCLGDPMLPLENIRKKRTRVHIALIGWVQSVQLITNVSTNTSNRPGPIFMSLTSFGYCMQDFDW
jgi:hypothetical protein